MDINSQKLRFMEQLQSYVDAFALSPYLLNSRVHPLRSFSSDKVQAYLKRDDELSFGVSGSKLRKYSSLIPFLLRRRVKRAVLVGGAYSNNILGISQLLIENGIQPVLLIRKPGNNIVRGNYLLTRLLIPEKDVITLDRDKWECVDQIAKNYGEEEGSFVIPEGAFLKESLYGAFSLPLDVLRNEQELGFEFDHIFIDAGTGLQAIALIMGLAFCRSKAKVHVLLLAQTQAEFEQRFGIMNSFLQTILEETNLKFNYLIHLPSEASSFGSTTAKGFSFIQQFARREGVLLDPIYSGKLVYEASKLIGNDEVEGRVLLIHSGGGLSLSGYQAQLQSSL